MLIHGEGGGGVNGFPNDELVVKIIEGGGVNLTTLLYACQPLPPCQTDWRGGVDEGLIHLQYVAAARLLRTR